MSKRSRKRAPPLIANEHRRWLPALLIAAFLAAAAVWGWRLRNASEDRAPIAEYPESPPPDEASPQAETLRIPEVAATRFRNANTTVEYVGSDACLACHPSEHDTYLHTTHSRSMAEVNVALEPPDGAFAHEISGRSYRVDRDGPHLRLRELLHDDDGREVTLVDCQARYALGSGNYARMYLVEVGDFLVEAPMTWYPRMNRWGMSAGYEKDPLQPGFNREIDTHCLYCHAGRVEAIDNAPQRLRVREMAIGCERCHGPGGLHIQEREAGKPITGEVDDSIVNLRHLARDRQEDICSQCHFSSSADIEVLGRRKIDFRPGQRMADFVIHYRIDRPDAAMTVSGQIEQMRLSRCYQQSGTMTCTTCHDPHADLQPASRAAHFRSKCLSCHAAEACTSPSESRQDKQDNCIACHMPRGPTDIPHFSFTHHRIGIHSEQARGGKLTAEDQLVAAVDVSHFPELEQQRQLGLANDVFSGKLFNGLDDETRYDASYRALAEVFQERARQILQRVHEQGVRGPAIETFFSRAYWRRDPQRCIEHAQTALTMPNAPFMRSAALYNLATSYFDDERYSQALPYLQELATIQRDEVTLMLLGICHQKQGNLPEAVRLFNEATDASPDRADLHRYLASIYRELGQTADADRHDQMARLLQAKVPQPK